MGTSADLVALNVARHSSVKDQPAVQQRDIDSLFQLLALISDPKAATARLKQLADATAGAASARAELAKLEDARAGLEGELAAARKRNEEVMADDRAAQQAELTRKHADLLNRERMLEQREAEVGKLHAEASKARDEAMEKIRVLKAALGSAA